MHLTTLPALSIFNRVASRLFVSKASTRLCLFVAGLLNPLAFAPFNLWPLALLSLWVLLISLVKTRPISAFKLGFYWGLGNFSVGASWVYVSIHEFGYVPWFGATLLTLAFVAYLSLFKAFFAQFTVKLIQLTSPLMLVFIAPMLWLISEYAQSTLFSGFPWLLTGYSQIDSPLKGIAAWLGVYGLSWFAMAFAAALCLLVYRQFNKNATHCLIALVSIVLLLSIFDTTSSNIDTPNSANNSQITLDIALVQPNVAQSIKWDANHFRQIIQVLREETKPLWGADLIIWPEGAIPAYAHQVKSFTDELTKSAIETNGHLIVGIPQFEPESEKSYVALKSYGAQAQDYFKQVLVPFGEYVPFQEWLRGMIRFLDLPMSNFVPATQQQPMTFERFSVIPAICYEVVYPSLLRALSIQADKLSKPQLIVTVSNDAWFGDSLGPHQHMQMARMRALELGMPLVRATNDGLTTIVDYQGQVLHQLPRYYQGSLRKPVTLTNVVTPYKRWGFWGIGMILLISGLFIIISGLKNRQLKTS